VVEESLPGQWLCFFVFLFLLRLRQYKDIDMAQDFWIWELQFWKNDSEAQKYGFFFSIGWKFPDLVQVSASIGSISEALYF
jgi:hypothetical protein